MPLISVGGNPLPTPSSWNVGLMDLSKAQRNARGTMIIERVRGNIRKIELTWLYLDAVSTSTIFNAVSSTVFTVTYMDPLTNNERTSTFYAGDRSAGMLDFNNGTARYKDVKFNLVER